MQTVSNPSSNRFKYFIYLVSFYFGLSVLLFKFFKYTVRQDLISYISISEKYYRGEFSLAVNGVWGPLISWLLIPFNSLPLNLIISFKILQICIGFITLIGIIKLFRPFDLPKNVVYPLLFSSIIFLQYYIFFTGTPDLLFACILLLLTIIIINQKFEKLTNSILFGFLGAALYYSKPIGLPFFFILVILVCVYSIKENRGVSKFLILRSATLSLIVFIVLTIPWIILLSEKYNEFTFSTGGNYNFNIIGPEYGGLHTPRIGELFPPINKSATSYWEDPTYLKIKNWNPFSSTGNFIYLIENICKNFVLILRHLLVFNPLFLLIVFLLIIDKKNKNYLLSKIGVIAIFYLFALAILFIEERFLIIIRIYLLVFMGYYLIQLCKKYNINKSISSMLIIIMIALNIAQPIYSLSSHFYEGKGLYKTAYKLSDKIEKGDRIVSVSEKLLDEDWAASLTLSYILRAYYYGELSSTLGYREFLKKLYENDINYLLVWDANLKIDKAKFKLLYETQVLVRNSLITENQKNYFALYKIMKLEN